MKMPAAGDLDLASLGRVPDPLVDVAKLPSLPPRVEPAARPRTRAGAAAIQRWALLGAVLYEVAWLVVLNKRGDLHTTPGRTLFVEVAIPVVAASIGVGAATTRGGRGLGPPKGWLAPLAVLAPVLFVVATLISAPADVDPESFGAHALRCFALTAVFAAGPLAFAGHAFRGAFVAAPAWRSATLAVGCAALAAVTTALACSVGSAAHVIVGHGSMMLVAAVIGALVGRRLAQA
jgi:hypothetical protein